MVKARPSPVSSLMVQLRYLLHIPLIGAKPAITVIFILQQWWDPLTTHHNLKEKKNQSCSESVTGRLRIKYQTLAIEIRDSIGSPTHFDF